MRVHQTPPERKLAIKHRIKRDDKKNWGNLCVPAFMWAWEIKSVERGWWRQVSSRERERERERENRISISRDQYKQLYIDWRLSIIGVTSFTQERSYNRRIEPRESSRSTHRFTYGRYARHVARKINLLQRSTWKKVARSFSSQGSELKGEGM